MDASSQVRQGFTVVDDGVAQSCVPGSDSVGNAYRCFGTDNGIRDPCWAETSNVITPTVICQDAPWDQTVHRLTLAQGGLQPFFDDTPAEVSSPWGVRLTTGERCVAEQGAHSSLPDGKREVIDYACQRPDGGTDRRVLLRDIDNSHKQWTIGSASYASSGNTYRRGPRITIDTAWFAVPDDADARADAAHVCSASALAHAAFVYEEAHHEPHGALPNLINHGCGSGYAIILFSTDGPNAYEASMAFGARASGWSYLGTSDYIPPGEFGIPQTDYAKIRRQLAERDDSSEAVPF